MCAHVGLKKETRLLSLKTTYSAVLAKARGATCHSAMADGPMYGRVYDCAHAL